MKKNVALIGIYLIIIISSVSCRKEHFLITDIRFLGAKLDYYGDEPKFNAYDSTKVFDKDIIFVISHTTEYVASLNINWVQNCYATKLERVCDNQLLHDTYSITFNKSFVYDNDTIATGQNIFQIDKIKNEINIFVTAMAFESAGADEVIDFSDTFISKVKFESGIYQVTFNCNTSDSREFEKKLDVEFRL